ncbi:MAG: hypothetical protein WBD32_12130, partial [Acidobacteriaceae bacterium]
AAVLGLDYAGGAQHSRAHFQEDEPVMAAGLLKRRLNRAGRAIVGLVKIQLLVLKTFSPGKPSSKS